MIGQTFLPCVKGGYPLPERILFNLLVGYLNFAVVEFRGARGTYC